MRKQTVVIISLLSFFVALFFNEYNLHLIRKSNPLNVESNTKSLVQNETICSADDVDYLSPVVNVEAGKGWKRSPAVSNDDSYRRTPGYSLLYYAFVKPFGYAAGHRALKYFQLLLFTISVSLFCFTVFEITKNKPATILLTLIYGIMPYFHGWVYFTITETITPALTVIFLYYLVKAYHVTEVKMKSASYAIASFFLGCLILTRPYMAIAGAMLAIFLLYDYYNQEAKRRGVFIKNSILIMLVPLSMVGVWTVRNYHVASEIVPLEKRYSPQSLDRMKPEFEGIFSFAKCWGEDGSYFNSYHQPFYFSSLRGDTGSFYIQKILAAWPSSVIEEFGYTRLFRILKDHQRALLMEKPYFDNHIAMPDRYLPMQINVFNRYKELIQEYKKNHFLGYWVRTPSIYLSRMIFHSNTAHLFLFQNNKNNLGMNIFRGLLLFIHVFVYIGLFFNLLFMKIKLNKFIFVYIPLLLIIFFIVIHREIEQRYMLPVLPVMLAGSGFALLKVISTYSKKQAPIAPD